jgi:hypothetical protein
MIRVVKERADSYRAVVTPPHGGGRQSSDYGPLPAEALIDALRNAGCHTTDITDALHEADPDWLASAPGQRALPPPWLEYPEVPYLSIGWRMGEGEGYMDRWFESFAGLSDSDADAYVRQYPEPGGWIGFYARQLAQRNR